MQWDVAWTDAILAAAAFHAALRCLARRSPANVGAAGLLLLALAAGLGALRFSIFPWLAPLHAVATGGAGAIGLPLLGLSYWLVASPAQERRLGAAAFAICLLGVVMLRVRLYWGVASAVAMLIVIWSGLRLGRREAVIGALLVMFAGMVVAGEGRWAGMERAAWFHLVMALACWYHGAGLRRTSH